MGKSASEPMRDIRFQPLVGGTTVEVHASGTRRSDPRCDVWQPQHRRETIMPRGDKSSYTDKQKRQAEHIEEGYEDRGVGRKEAERRAWATVNKETGGGNKSGSGRGVPDSHVS